MEEQNTQTGQRPGFLTVLCILTFIGSGLSILFSLLGIFGIGALNNFASAYGVDSGETGVFKLILMVIFSGASLYGAIMMWNLKKIGFYLYVAAQILMVVFGFGWIALFFAALFVVLYYLNLKHLA